MLLLLADRIACGDWRLYLQKPNETGTIHFSIDSRLAQYAVEFWLDSGAFSAYMCRADVDVCGNSTFLMHWEHINTHAVFDVAVTPDTDYQVVITADTPQVELFVRLVSLTLNNVTEPEDSDLIVPNRLQKPLVTEQQNDQALIAELAHNYTQINVDFTDISRQTPFSGVQGRTLHPLLFTRSYFEGACYATVGSGPVFFEVLYKQAVKPKYLVVGHPRCPKCAATAPKTIWVSYIRVAAEGIQLRELRPFQYNIDGPVEQVFRLADYAFDETDDVLRIKVQYDGYGDSICAYYFGIFGQRYGFYDTTQ